MEDIGHDQRHAHARLTQVALNAARRLRRQNRSAEGFAALQAAVAPLGFVVLRFVVNARAGMAVLEAAACLGRLPVRSHS